MKKKLLIVATVLIVTLFTVIAVSCVTEPIHYSEAKNYVLVDDFRTVRNAFDCEILLPVDNALNAEIKMTTIEILRDKNEANSFIYDINNHRKVGYVYAVEWTHKFTEYDISVEILKDEDFKNYLIEYDEINIHGYSGVQSKHNFMVILYDTDNRIQYTIRLITQIEDTRIDIDKTIREYIDGMCLRNGNGFKKI